MTASERLTELHVAWDFGVMIALPEIAAVVAAAEKMSAIEAETDIVGKQWFARHGEAVFRMGDALAELNRALGNKP